MDEGNRQKVDEEAIARLGILGRVRPAGGALTAMRRQVMRERMKNTHHDTDDTSRVTPSP